MFPIGWMYYFGTNLENRFNVPDFWPEPETTHKIPYEKEEQLDMVNKLKASRLERRRKRLETEKKFGAIAEGEEDAEGTEAGTVAAVHEMMGRSAEGPREAQSRNTLRVGMIDKWASGKQ